jgi:hypothetical protein
LLFVFLSLKALGSEYFMGFLNFYCSVELSEHKKIVKAFFGYKKEKMKEEC